ncbi:amidohydrolase [Sinomonas halotolerans]|uniref:Amidohydrolase n=1 Tax=Sinomonas halotolerans TaxID=1644133 RepID=A0ABU9WY36_9MICC
MSSILFTDANFRTLDPLCPSAEALLAQQGRVVATGSVAELRERAPQGTAEVALGGGTAVPGFTDAHIHTASLARALHSVALHSVVRLEEALARLEEHLAGTADRGWVFGGWWDCNRWAVPVQPDRHSLDSVCSDRPVALTSADGHTVWCNTLGLRRLGIDATTPDPAGGEYVRDASGEPTGILRESAVFPVRALEAQEGAASLPAQIASVQKLLLANGVTSVHDIDGPDALEAYRALRAEGRLAVRLNKLIRIEDLDTAIAEGARTGEGDEWIRTGAVKIFSDGAAGSHTCHMSEHFPGDEGDFGIEVTPYRELVRLTGRAVAAGLAVAVHAIGDRANQLVLEALSELRDVTARHGLRHRIEHAQFLRPSDVPRFAELGVIASMQPQHCPSDYQLRSLLEGRGLAAYAWRSLLDAGAVLAFGSDAPVEEPRPLLGLHAAVTRSTPAGVPSGGWDRHERITAEEALLAYTVGAAWASGEEKTKGRLGPGMLADFAVIDVDPLACAPDALATAGVTRTVVDGVVRHSA